MKTLARSKSEILAACARQRGYNGKRARIDDPSFAIQAKASEVIRAAIDAINLASVFIACL